MYLIVVSTDFATTIVLDKSHATYKALQQYCYSMFSSE